MSRYKLSFFCTRLRCRICFLPQPNTYLIKSEIALGTVVYKENSETSTVLCVHVSTFRITQLTNLS